MHVNLCRAVAGFLATTALGLGTIALAIPPTGGTGPGGFTLTGATSDMVLWTQAGSIGGADGSAVTAWGDLSGRTNNLGNPIVSGAGITYETNESNGLSAVQFQSNSALRNVNAVAPLVNGQSGDWFVVMRTPDDDGINGGGFHRTGTSSNQHTTWGDGNVYENFATDNRFQGNPTAVLSDYHLYNVYGRNNTTGTAADPAWAMFINGTMFANKVANGVTNYFAGVNQWEIGRGSHLGDDPWNGHLSEMVMFNRALNMAERHIVENSLHAKYNLPAPLEALTDFYSGDTGPNGNFDSEVFGVGRVNATNVTPTAGSGAGGFGIAATAGLDDGEFIMAGHKVATNGTTTADLPAQHLGERWTREWFVDTNGDAVDLQLAFDFATDGIASTDASDEYQLLFRPNESTDYLILSDTGTISGNNVLFNLNSSAIGNGIVTLGINVQAVPEPAAVVMWSLLGMVGLAFGGRRRFVQR